MRIQQRVLAVKVAIDWKEEESKALYNRLRDLGWMAAHYRNEQSVAKLAQLRGWRVDPEVHDKNDVSKQIRQSKKGELSGDAYSAAEQEVKGAWTRDAKKIRDGQPVPMWKPSAALAVSGKEKYADSGIRLRFDGTRYLLLLRAQSKDSPGGSWLTLPVAKNTKRDEWQAEILDKMLDWSVPIKKVTIHIERHGITARLTYRIELPDLPRMGERVATIGPVTQDGRLRLYADGHAAKDYTSKLEEIRDKKDRWDLVRRRCLSQIGRKHGHARAKRRALFHLSADDWMHNHIHTWTRQIIDWCEAIGIGTLQVASLETLDWPAYGFRQQLAYKAEEAGIKIEDAQKLDKTAERSIKAVLGKGSRQTRKLREAVREITHQVKERGIA